MQPGGQGFSLWVPTTAQDLIALYFPFELVRVPISLPRGGSFTKQSIWKWNCFQVGHQALRKIFQLKIDRDLVICGNVFSFKYGAGDFFFYDQLQLKKCKLSCFTQGAQLVVGDVFQIIKCCLYPHLYKPLPSQSLL